MTIDPNSPIFRLLLSLDSYNRGYGASINLTNAKVGIAEIVQTTVDGQSVNLDSSRFIRSL